MYRIEQAQDTACPLHLHAPQLSRASVVNKYKSLLSTCGFLDWPSYSILVLVQISSFFWAPSICVLTKDKNRPKNKEEEEEEEAVCLPGGTVQSMVLVSVLGNISV